MVYTAVYVKMTITDDDSIMTLSVGIVPQQNVKKYTFNYNQFIDYIGFFLSQIPQKPVKAALAPSLCLAVSSLRLVFQLTSYTSMIPAAKERSGMAEWNSILITRNTSVAHILW